jgi:wyosine [tRNA(Phe)-imidazoG37] synthetase (radical SAM superfamily)
MNVLPLETAITYGPLFSRRLGRSLGVNLLPFDCKVCSFDCIYCHYGHTTVFTLTPGKRDLEIAATFPDVDTVLQTIETALRRYPHVDALTFSGNGEPTLHPHFPAIVAETRRLRDALAPNVKLALFSNATTAHLPHIQESLREFDLPILKLDAGDPATLARINRPAPGVTLDTILAGLRATPNLIVQSVLIDGNVSNIKGEPFEAWITALDAIRPAIVQIYSTDYPVSDAGVERVLPYVLKRIAGEVIERTGVRVEAFWW